MSPDIARHGTVVLLCSLTRSLGWILAAFPASAQAQVGTSGAAGQVVDPRATEGTALVYSEDSAEPLVASADSPQWLDGASVVSIEWTYGASDPVSPVGAIGGGKRWPFHLDRAKRWAVLKVTDEIREAWETAGTLGISCEGNRLVELRCRPRRLLLGPEGEEFSVDQRSSGLVPGSREWVEVLVGDILFGSGRLGVYTVEGETLARPRPVAVGDEVPFRIGEEEYRIEVGLLQGGLIGSHFAKLLVKKAAGAEMPAQTMRTRLIALVEQELAKVDRDFDHAMRLRRAGREGEGRAALETARRIADDVRRGLRSIERLAPRLEKMAPYLSIIKARIVRPPPPEGPFDSPEPAEAKVLEVRKVGRKYEPWTIRGRQHPFAKRGDLVRGQSVKLSFYDGDPEILVDKVEDGPAYWLVLGTSVAMDGPPRLMGAPGRSDVVFAMPVREP
ncbi:MAG: hypothetical protein L0323_11700 [Planctomycetes bacterium]|nr:hypothetical protein [Planctomycetota bacterium]